MTCTGRLPVPLETNLLKQTPRANRDRSLSQQMRRPRRQAKGWRAVWRVGDELWG